MADTDTTPGLKLITWNVGRSSISRFEEQLQSLQDRTPGIVALQEVISERVAVRTNFSTNTGSSLPHTATTSVLATLDGVQGLHSRVGTSQRLGATEATYLHQYEGLSDHTPLEAVFEPFGGLHDEVEAIDRVPHTPPEDDGDEPTPSGASFGGLTYDRDVSMFEPDESYCRGRFKAG